jgi:membrane protease YdiL (CAAX protease family)
MTPFAVSALGIAALTLAAMTVIGNVSKVWLARIDTQASAYRAVTAPQDKTEAAAFLIVALTAGFVEEFVFRGYLQKQFQAFCGKVPVASTLQVLVFTQAILYQGWI